MTDSCVAQYVLFSLLPGSGSASIPSLENSHGTHIEVENPLVVEEKGLPRRHCPLPC